MSASQLLKWGGLLLLSVVVQAGWAQKKGAAKDSAQVAAALNGHRFVFVPQQMMPMGGRVRQVTPDYTVKVSGDTLRSYLPYVGRAYSAPIGATTGPLDFTTPVTYTLATRKKGGWLVTLKPVNSRDIQRYEFTIFDSGSASLSVTSTNRQPISYNGYVQPVGQK